MKRALPFLALLLPAVALGQTTPANQSLNLPVVPTIGSVNTTGTHGSVATATATGSLVYTPGSYFATLPQGQTGTDSFGYCVNSLAGQSLCGTVKVTVTGTATAPPIPPNPPNQSYTCVRNWYVATTGSDSAAGTVSAPWKTIQHADTSGLLKPGDCVNVSPGSYPQPYPLTLNNGGTANSATGYVVYRSTTPQGAKIKPSANVYDVVDVNGNYMIVDGFEIDGGNEGLTANPVSQGTCLQGGGHHFQALNNLAHDCGGEGVGALYKDWYWFVGNTTYNNAFFNTYQESGISIYEPRAVSYTATPADANATYHIIVTNNVSYNNSEKYVPGAHTDGEGIIFDDFQNTQSGNAAYPFASLIQGNTVYGNGGRGIQVSNTNNATVTGNIAYNDNLDTADSSTWRGELENLFASNNSWTNNQASATSTATGITSNNTAVADGYTGTPETNVVWTGNPNFDTRTGKQSYYFTNAAAGAAFPGANPLGHALP